MFHFICFAHILPEVPDVMLRSEPPALAAKQRIDGKCLSPNFGPRSTEARARLDYQETTISSSWTRSASFLTHSYTHTQTHSYGSWTAWGTRMSEGTRTQETVVSLTLVFRAVGSCDLYPRVAANPAPGEHLG